MELLFQYYDLILVVFVVLCALGYGVYKFISTPSEKQKEQIRTVLLQLVVQAETAFGSKTGKIKFSFVYGELLKRFVWLKHVPLAVIEQLIEESLDTMRHLLETNQNVREIVEGDE